MNEGYRMIKKNYTILPQGTYGVKKFYGKYLENQMKEDENQQVIELNSPEKLGDLGKKSGFLFSIDNFQSNIRDGKGNSIYKSVNMPHVNYLWSSAAYLNHSIEELTSRQRIMVRDRHQADYLKKYYHLESELLPLFGIKSKKLSSWEKRDISVFFPGSYLDEDSVLNQIKAVFPEVMGEIARGAISILEKSNFFLIEEGIEQYLDSKGVSYTDETIRAYVEEYGFAIDSYLNRKNRNRVMRLIVAQGIPVVVCGVNWEVFRGTLSEKEQSYLTIIGENLSGQAVADYMSRSKIVLNLSPNLIDGLHERVTSALVNGAICITDENPYVIEKVKNEDVVELFQWKTCSSIPKKIKKILQQEVQSEQKSLRAIDFGEKNYSVKQFWEKIGWRQK